MPHFEDQMQLQQLKSLNQTSKSMNSGDALESSHTSKLAKREEVEELPWDVLDRICKTLDFDDLFQFSGVCKSWMTFHKSNFLSSEEPLLVRRLVHNGAKQVYSFISISSQKVYDLNIMSCFQPPNFTYIRASGQYFIMVRNNNSFLLFNPFTRIKRVINATFKVPTQFFGTEYHTLLAFEKFSDDKEFVLLVFYLESRTLYVYRSRHNSWVRATYSTVEPEDIVDFVVFNNIIYVLTHYANIGVLNLNSGNIQFLNFNNAPKYICSRYIRLVNCDEQLFMFNLLRRKAYKIDLSTKSYVKMKSLGDIALFYVSDRHCQALSNPKRFGYQSNCVYKANITNQCEINLWSNGSETKTYQPPGSETNYNLFDWCFRHLKFEVDYSLVQ